MARGCVEDQVLLNGGAMAVCCGADETVWTGGCGLEGTKSVYDYPIN